MVTRLPLPGAVKTRLVPALGAKGAARLHRALTEHVAREVFALGATREAVVEVWHDGGDQRRMRSWLGPLPRYRPQPPGDLGDRLRHVFATAFREGAERCVVVGSDCPAMTADHLRTALRRLRGHGVVFGPAADGGYWLVGLSAAAARKGLDELFRAIPWGGPAVLQTSLERARERSLSAAVLAQLSDVDRPGDLAEWERAREPAGAALRVSVVVPTRNEADRVPACIARALAGGFDEVIVVDGGSGDDTCAAAAAAGARVLSSEPGRARQMNAGAATARGDALLFLHADTLLPQTAAAAVRQALADERVRGGAFTYAARGAGLWDPLITLGNRIRCRLTGYPYGDQALFLRARTFRALGGFPDLPVMEDWEMVRRLRRLGRLAVVRDVALTSTDSFAGAALFRASWRNLVTIAGYRVGVDPHVLAAYRNRVARRPAPTGDDYEV